MGRLVDENDVYSVLTEYYHHKTATQHVVLIDALSTVKTVDAIPVDYLNSLIAEFRAKDTYANQFAADFLQAIINEYNKEVHNGKTE